MDTVKDSEGSQEEYGPQDPDVRLACLLSHPHAVHLLIEQLPDPRAVELLKAWSNIVLDTEENTNTVLWYVKANLRPMRPGRAGVTEMVERWKAEEEAPYGPEQRERRRSR